MPFHIRDAETDSLVRTLAKERNLGLTEAVRVAVANELRRGAPSQPMIERIREIQREVASARRTGPKADKAFYDQLSGDDD